MIGSFREEPIKHSQDIHTSLLIFYQHPVAYRRLMADQPSAAINLSMAKVLLEKV